MGWDYREHSNSGYIWLKEGKATRSPKTALRAILNLKPGIKILPSFKFHMQGEMKHLFFLQFGVTPYKINCTKQENRHPY